jgi:TM2 domain-containing membrane protein YozV
MQNLYSIEGRLQDDMHCSYHPSNAARAQCASCLRSLCAGCDHRIKGYPYCQDCIVLGIQTLSQQQQRNRSRRTARVAALFGIFLPGLGAVYNRQNVKALAHFLTVVGLFQLRHLGILGVPFFLGGLAFYIYSIVDAYRTAHLVAQGESPAANEEEFKSRVPAIGLGLVVVGALLAIQFLLPFGIPLARLIPVALILLGGYLVTSYFKRARDGSYGDYFDRKPHGLAQGQFVPPGASGRTEAHPWRPR